MLTDKRASEIPQFVVVLAIVVVLGAAAVWGILSNIGTQGNSVATWIDSIAVPAAHPYPNLTKLRQPGGRPGCRNPGGCNAV